jgi:xylan 1,4-beta-xylosidase
MSRLSIRPQWHASGEPFRHSWEGQVNIDQFRWMVRKDCLEHLALARDELKADKVRAVGMFCDELRVVARDPRGFRDPARREPRVNWQIVDYVIDELLDLGIKPMFTTSFMPAAFASGQQTTFTTRSNVTPPIDHVAWGRFVEDAVRHQIARYGLAEVRSWLFEVWNEPNLEGFWSGGQDGFWQLWDSTWHAIKRVDGDLRIGGPSTARAEWVQAMLEHARGADTVPDYIITHIYNNDSESGALSPFDGPQADRVNQSPFYASGVIKGTRKLLDDLDFTGPIQWNEWGRSWFPCDPVRESAYEAAWVCMTMAEASQYGDEFGYWNLSDIYDQCGYGAETFHGNYGMLNLQGLRKPQWQAFRLLSRLGNRRLPVTGDGLTTNRGAIATSDGAQRSVLVFNLEERPEQPAVDCDLSLALPADAGRVRAWRIDAATNNILATWRDLGAADVLTRDLRETLHAANALQEVPAAELAVVDGELRSRLGSPGVLLVELD